MPNTTGTTPAGERNDVEALADTVLDAVEHDVEDCNTSGLPDVLVNTVATLRELGVSFVRRYHRLSVEIDAEQLGSPVLFVANHGFGGIFDLNVFATLAALNDLGFDRPVTAPTHQLAWTLRVGRLIEPLGAQDAAPEDLTRQRVTAVGFERRRRRSPALPSPAYEARHRCPAHNAPGARRDACTLRRTRRSRDAATLDQSHEGPTSTLRPIPERTHHDDHDVD